MNIAALMNVTVDNGYTPAEEQAAMKKLENVSAYEKEQALLQRIKPQSPVEASPYIEVNRDDPWILGTAARVVNAVTWLTEPRKE